MEFGLGCPFDSFHKTSISLVSDLFFLLPAFLNVLSFLLSWNIIVDDYTSSEKPLFVSKVTFLRC